MLRIIRSNIAIDAQCTNFILYSIFRTDFNPFANIVDNCFTISADIRRELNGNRKIFYGDVNSALLRNDLASVLEFAPKEATF